MGNRSSNAAPSSTMGSSTTVDKRRDDNDGNGGESGLYLSPELQGEKRWRGGFIYPWTV